MPIGPYRLPISGAQIRGLRKSKPFWSVLGDAGVFSAVLRVPITFPCDKIDGEQLAAKSVHDVLGTQGTHFRYVEANGGSASKPAKEESSDSYGAGQYLPLQTQGNVLAGHLQGPANPLRGDAKEVRIPFTVKRISDHRAVLTIGSQRLELIVGQHSEWTRVTFRLAPAVRLRGICRYNIRQIKPHLELY